MTIFLRAIEAENKERFLHEAIKSCHEVRENEKAFAVNPEGFRRIPGAPFAYWVSEEIRAIFERVPAFQQGNRIARLGGSTKNDGRFLRLWWEIGDFGEDRWFSFAKGGAFSQYYADIYLLVNWKDDAREIEAELLRKYPYLEESADFVLHRELPYGRPGLTWPRRTTSGLALRAMPGGCIFADKGPAAFVEGDFPTSLLALLATTNSQAFRALVALQLAAADAAARSYEVGIIQRTPVPELTEEDQRALADLAGRAWSMKRGLDSSELTSHAFVLPALLQVSADTSAEGAVAWAERVASSEQGLVEIQAEVDQRCFDLYGFTAKDREQAMQGQIAESDEGSDEEEDSGATARDNASLSAELVDWLVGAAFGRFDVRLTTGQRQWPAEPGPFDVQPSCSPGMLTDDRGFPVGSAPNDYPLELPFGGLLVDDPGLDADLPAEWDIVRRIREVLSVVFGYKATDIEAELCDLLGTRDLRTYLRRPNAFFADHLSRYSKSRRKAPIYWPLSTVSGNYTVWVYYPNLDSDTLYQIVNEHVAPKISEVETRLAQLERARDQSEGREATRLAKSISELSGMLDELKELRQNLQQAAELPYMPNQDDGVQITAAPLWQLFRHKPWRKLLDKTWRELSRGDYDWAHLAYEIWPERVTDACREDKSIAIAHGLEDLYEEEG